MSASCHKKDATLGTCCPSTMSPSARLDVSPKKCTGKITGAPVFFVFFFKARRKRCGREFPQLIPTARSVRPTAVCGGESRVEGGRGGGGRAASHPARLLAREGNRKRDNGRTGGGVSRGRHGAPVISSTFIRT